MAYNYFVSFHTHIHNLFVVWRTFFMVVDSTKENHTYFVTTMWLRPIYICFMCNVQHELNMHWVYLILYKNGVYMVCDNTDAQNAQVKLCFRTVFAYCYLAKFYCKTPSIHQSIDDTIYIWVGPFSCILFLLLTLVSTHLALASHFLCAISLKLIFHIIFHMTACKSTKKYLNIMIMIIVVIITFIYTKTWFDDPICYAITFSNRKYIPKMGNGRKLCRVCGIIFQNYSLKFWAMIWFRYAFTNVNVYGNEALLKYDLKFINGLVHYIKIST